MGPDSGVLGGPGKAGSPAAAVATGPPAIRDCPRRAGAIAPDAMRGSRLLTNMTFFLERHSFVAMWTCLCLLLVIVWGLAHA
jgi:hypothetical protein